MTHLFVSQARCCELGRREKHHVPAAEKPSGFEQTPWLPRTYLDE